MSASTSYAVTVNGLCKSYGPIKALNGISLNIEAGRIFGLLGPNGSGKTTLIRSLIGSLRPNEGQIRVLGLDPLKDKSALRQWIGYMPQLPAVYEDLSARDNILFFGEILNVKDIRRKTERMLHFTELSHRADDPVSTYSGGMKKRVSLACAMLHEPRALLLDEPTAAVDPHIKIQSWELFRKLADSGVTMVISTHLMDEAMRCDQLCIMNRGEVVITDTPRNILSRGRTLMRHVQSGRPLEKTISSDPSALAQELHQHGLDKNISSIDLYPDTIEDIMLRIVDDAKSTE